MKLWTWQGRDFKLTSGCVDYLKSPYCKTHPELIPAYQELSQFLGTDQIIWCCVREDEFVPDKDRPVRWELDVPDNEFGKGEFPKICNSFIWAKMVGWNELPIPRELYAQWKGSAPLSDPDRTRFIEQKVQEYREEPPPEGGWISQLFISDATCEGANVLLKHPIPESWIVRSEIEV